MEDQRSSRLFRTFSRIGKSNHTEGSSSHTKAHSVDLRKRDAIEQPLSHASSQHPSLQNNNNLPLRVSGSINYNSGSLDSASSEKTIQPQSNITTESTHNSLEATKTPLSDSSPRLTAPHSSPIMKEDPTPKARPASLDLQAISIDPTLATNFEFLSKPPLQQQNDKTPTNAPISPEESENQLWEAIRDVESGKDTSGEAFSKRVSREVPGSDNEPAFTIKYEITFLDGDEVICTLKDDPTNSAIHWENVLNAARKKTTAKTKLKKPKRNLSQLVTQYMESGRKSKVAMLHWIADQHLRGFKQTHLKYLCDHHSFSVRTYKVEIPKKTMSNPNIVVSPTFTTLFNADEHSVKDPSTPLSSTHSTATSTISTSSTPSIHFAEIPQKTLTPSASANAIHKASHRRAKSIDHSKSSAALLGRSNSKRQIAQSSSKPPREFFNTVSSAPQIIIHATAAANSDDYHRDNRSPMSRSLTNDTSGSEGLTPPGGSVRRTSSSSDSDSSSRGNTTEISSGTTKQFTANELKTLLETLIKEERFVEALECSKFYDILHQLETLQVEYDRAKQEDRLEDAIELRKKMSQLQLEKQSFSMEKVGDEWAKPPPVDHFTLQQIQEILVAEAGTKIMLPFIEEFGETNLQEIAKQDLRKAVGLQERVYNRLEELELIEHVWEEQRKRRKKADEERWLKEAADKKKKNLEKKEEMRSFVLTNSDASTSSV